MYIYSSKVIWLFYYYISFIHLVQKITGGYSNPTTVNIYDEDGSFLANCPNLPDERVAHTMDGNILCGGLFTNTSRTCLQFNAGNWTQFQVLKKERFHHSSWKRHTGEIVLMGGRGSLQTSEFVTSNGSIDGFALKYKTE